MASEKIFLLGVGCQKGGTTWLHRYLHSHPQTDMGLMKEYHIFDALYVPECRHFLNTNASEILVNDSNKNSEFDKKSLAVSMRVKCFNNIESYFDYFQSLLNSSDDVTLAGDISPSYAALPSEALSVIKNGMEKRGIKVKVLFLMRDPVERCLSAVRMDYRQRGINPSINEESQALKDTYQTRNFLIRTRYQDTIRNLESVFSSANIYYGFYEELFTPIAIQKLTQFLSLPYIPPAFEKKFNFSKTDNELGLKLRNEVASFYRDTYLSVSEKFGQSRIESLWKNYQLLKDGQETISGRLGASS